MNLNYMSNSNKDWRNTWIIVCHALWTWRNQEEHDDNYARPIDPFNHIFRRSDEYLQAMDLYKNIREEGSGNKFLGWKPPTSGMIKLNKDGASRSYSGASCGGVIRP